MQSLFVCVPAVSYLTYKSIIGRLCMCTCSISPVCHTPWLARLRESEYSKPVAEYRVQAPFVDVWCIFIVLTMTAVVM